MEEPDHEDYLLLDDEGNPVDEAAEASLLMSLDFDVSERDVSHEEWYQDALAAASMIRERSREFFDCGDETEASIVDQPRASMDTDAPADTGRQESEGEPDDIAEGMDEPECTRTSSDLGEMDEWVLEKILRRQTKRRPSRGTREVFYSCKWKWYRNPTWEPRSVLEDEGYAEILEAFDRSLIVRKQRAQTPLHKPTEPRIIKLIPEFVRLVEEKLSEDGLHLNRYAFVKNGVKEGRFVAKWRSHDPSVVPIVLFHGTRLVNMLPIAEKGLIIPGACGVRVANGSAFGVGIYTARDPGYSRSYSSDSRMIFACVGLVGPKVTCSLETPSICVFFDTDAVVPVLLFEYSEGSAEHIAEEVSLKELLVRPAPDDAHAACSSQHRFTKKMLKQAPRRLKDLYMSGVLRAKR
jgi:hypothetical protein